MSDPVTPLSYRGVKLPSFSRLTETELYEAGQERPVLVDANGDVVAPAIQSGRMSFEDRLFLIMVDVLKGEQRKIESLQDQIHEKVDWMTANPEQITEVDRVWLTEANLELRRLIDTYEEIFKTMTEIHKAQVETWEMARQGWS